MVTSCRKFDRFGDWFVVRLMLRHPVRAWRALHGRDAALADRYWYDIERGPARSSCRPSSSG